MIDFKSLDLAEILPHSGSMIWLDRIVDFDGDLLTATLHVRDVGLSAQHHAIPAWIGLEYMAQAIAAYLGLAAKIAGKPVRPGYLLGTRRYDSNVAELAVDTALTVRVEKFMQDERLGIFDCWILGEHIEISSRLSVYDPGMSRIP